MKYCNHPKTKNELLSEAYIKYRPELRLYFLKYKNDEMKADDMIQDLFLKLLEFKGEIIESSIKGLLFSSARHLVQDDYRLSGIARRSVDTYYDMLARHHDDYSVERIQCAQIVAMEKALVGQMPNGRARVYNMSRFGDMSIDDISEVLQISRRTVEAHLYQSRKAVRQTLRECING